MSYADFVDNTMKFKGGWVQFEMTLNHVGDTLRAHSGGRAEFYLNGDNAKGVIMIDIPVNLNLPNATDADNLLVTFDCVEGRLDSGNVAREIRRP